ncbi:MAG: hypothetical protein FJY74_06355 [Candidatus Eisenbacteria bacterium]|nr:hypothetical protein [Candidatus Eisenbacteria bacterium]
MNGMTKLMTLSALAAVVVMGAGCILEETDVELVVKATECMTFDENHTSETFVTPRTLNLADELDDALEDFDVEREDLVRGGMIMATYEVTVPPVHDWTLTGGITVERVDKAAGPVTVVNYTSQSLMDAYGEPVFADLVQAGVDLINDAIDDYIENTTHPNPVLLFKVVNGDCDPNPSVADPLVFEWDACVQFYVVIRKTLEVPDPFPGSD